MRDNVSEDWIQTSANGARLRIHVVPNAKRTEVIGLQAGMLKIKLHAAPVDGKANDALVKFIAERLCLLRRDIVVSHGHSSRQKVLDIDHPGLSRDVIASALWPEAAVNPQSDAQAARL